MSCSGRQGRGREAAPSCENQPAATAAARSSAMGASVTGRERREGREGRAARRGDLRRRTRSALAVEGAVRRNPSLTPEAIGGKLSQGVQQLAFDLWGLDVWVLFGLERSRSFCQHLCQTTAGSWGGEGGAGGTQVDGAEGAAHRPAPISRRRSPAGVMRRRGPGHAGSPPPDPIRLACGMGERDAEVGDQGPYLSCRRMSPGLMSCGTMQRSVANSSATSIFFVKVNRIVDG